VAADFDFSFNFDFSFTERGKNSVMHLTPTIDALLNRLQSTPTEQIQLLSKLLDLKIGNIFAAQAQKITHPTQEETLLLLNIINTKLTQLNKNSAAPAVQDQIKQLQELQKLLQNPNLKLVELKIVTPKGTQNLLTYTDQAVTIDQEVPLKINQKQQLELLTTNTDKNNQQNITQKDIIIKENLRQLLPKQNVNTDLITHLPKLLKAIQDLSLIDRKNTVPPPILQALTIIAKQIKTAPELSHPETVKSVIKNNGQLFEKELTRGLTPRVERIIERDLKGALLNLLTQVEKELPKITLNNPLNKDILSTDIFQLLAQLNPKQLPQLDNKHLRNQLILLLHQYTLGSLNKIQLQQIHALATQTETKENSQLSSQPSQSWQLEIPIRQGTDVQPLQIRIDQYWIEDKEESANKSKTKERQWNILLSFNLANAGSLDVQLTLLKNQLSAKFWAEKPRTFQLTKDKIDSIKTQLEKEGLTLVQLECLQGKSPQPKMSLSYSLVDIKT
jgi:Flagellar hook-length control protein FliK